MPRGDCTGPSGQGSRTGRALGYCAGYDSPGYTKDLRRGLRRGLTEWSGGGYGRGGSCRRGGGRGFSGNWVHLTPNLVSLPVYSHPITPEAQLPKLKQEKQFLESEMEGIKSAIDNISKKIEELEKTE